MQQELEVNNIGIHKEDKQCVSCSHFRYNIRTVYNGVCDLEGGKIKNYNNSCENFKESKFHKEQRLENLRLKELR